MNHLEFLIDTVDFYSADVSRRAVDSHGNCVYETSIGTKCAIGRYVRKARKVEVLRSGGPVDSLLDDIPDCLEKSVAHLNKNFLVSVQKFHDIRNYWGEKSGLTSVGKDVFKQLKTQAKRYDAIQAKQTS